MRATAAVFRGVGQPFDRVSWTLPEPAGREVLVEVVACTLCGSDLHSIHGRRSVPTPSVLGHEILGRIVAFGQEAPRLDSAGKKLAEGDRVTWAVVAHCGDCFYCHRDLPQKCERGFKYGHEPLRPGRELSGGLADHCLLVPGTAIFRVPDGLSDAAACPASCATATVAAALEAAGPLDGRSVLVIGAGMLGVTATAWSRVLGAGDVITCDPSEERLALAAAFGATRSTSPSRLVETVTESTGGRGMDIALEFSGSPNAIEAALPLLGTGGTLVLVGSVFPTRPLSVDPERIVRRCITIQGIHNYMPRHLQRALEFLARNPQYPFDSLVSSWQPLGEIDAIVGSDLAKQALRVGVRPDVHGSPAVASGLSMSG
ncbi:zinc-binding dehydrogenase [Singulisphaera acidiphila]|uniref:alcohol dehydrogenase n=3 Tax=Singulisphaera acidiphila TaxID=466153 RepID=L0D6E6_SINAD|nr:zinc-binding dehydrogenase [Singulisphaera acidiphila]AGA24832.1 putative phosphonate catabolism associated alcohol dehydrogenase [Singulisphaera acidiphila DSM 18658]